MAASSVPPTLQDSEAERRRLASDAAGCLSVAMFDSYGDGWGGGIMVIAHEGDNDSPGATSNSTTIVWSGTVKTGKYYSELVCGLDRGACFDIAVSADDYPSEVSWTVEAAAADGGASAAGGAPSTAQICLIAGPTASPTLTLGPTLTAAPTGECWPPGTVCFSASSWKEVEDGLGPGLFD